MENNISSSEIKPADPLINRKIIPLNPPIFSREGSYIILRPFNNNYFSPEEFILKPKEKTDILMKDTIIELYINSLKLLQRLIYYKEPIDKDVRVTVENIVNLRQIKRKKRKKNNIIDNNTIFKERVEKIGIEYDNLLIFESHFESGNLQLAYITETLGEQKNNINSSDLNKVTENNINNSNNSDINIINSNANINNSTDNNTFDGLKKEEIEKYELFLHNDTNTSGYTQWFFFRVSNTKKGKTVNLNIMNLQRKRTKYSNGIKIWCYSRKNSDINKVGWHHTTEKVNYYKNFLYKLNKGKKEYYYTLSFNYTFQFDNDEVFFANCIPFTYTDLTRDLNLFTKSENDKYIFFDRKKLCSTIIGNEVEYFTINSTPFCPSLNNSNSSMNKTKSGVVLFGRQHPSETVGSWTIKGAIDFLMGESDEANYLRDNFIFKIIPMINVDGVVCGNTRTSLSGCDLNRRWSNPNVLLHPEIFYAKELIIDFCKRNNIECIVDFHGHFGAFNSFFYGNRKEDNYSSCKFFPFTCAKKSKVIQFEKSKFQMPKYKKGTGRINLFNELNVENVVTLETSYFGCNSGGYTNQYFTIETLKEIGRDICNGILLFHYHSNLKLGIDNNLNSYPLLLNKVENDEKIINTEFTEYLNKIKNEKNEDNNSEEEDNKSKKDNKKEKDDKNDEDDDEDDYLNDEVSDSESDPSGDNLDESEVLKLLPPVKKLKKVRKNFKNKKINKRNLIGLNNNNNMRFNSNDIFTQKKKNNSGLNNLNLLSSPFIKENQNKPKINNMKNFNSIDVNVKSKRDIINVEEKSLTINANKSNINNLSRIQKDLSTKSLLFKINGDSPISSLINSNKPNINININISLSKSININIVDKFTQTEEMFFKYSWKSFIGLYKIITPKIEKYPLICQLKPIKFNSIKNSYSFTNRKDFFYNSSIIPPPQTIDLSQSKKYPQHNILNMMKFNQINFETINNDKLNKGNRNASMLRFGPLFNNNIIMEKTGNLNNNRYRNLSNQDRIKALKIKNQKLINFPVVKSKNIFFKNLSDKKEN